MLRAWQPWRSRKKCGDVRAFRSGNLRATAPTRATWVHCWSPPPPSYFLRICHVRFAACARDVAATHAARPESGYTAAVAHGPRRYVALPASRLTYPKPATRRIGPTGPSLLAATRGLHDRGHARHGDAHYRGPRDDSLHEPFAGHAALHLAATRSESVSRRQSRCPAQSARCAFRRARFSRRLRH